MAAAAKNRDKFRKPSDLIDYPVAAGVHIFKDTMVVLDTSGYLRPARAGTATDVFAGFCRDEVDNTSGGAGAKTGSVDKTGTMAVKYAGTIDPSVNGKEFVALDDQTVALTGTGAIAVGRGVYDPDPSVADSGMIRINVGGYVK